MALCQISSDCTASTYDSDTKKCYFGPANKIILATPQTAANLTSSIFMKSGNKIEINFLNNNKIRINN